MDRIDAIKVFVTALDEGSLAGASRKLGRSPAAVSRAVAFLENQASATRPSAGACSPSSMRSRFLRRTRGRIPAARSASRLRS
jgi:DNA-binding transcriptional LysR family regulator